MDKNGFLIRVSVVRIHPGVITQVLKITVHNSLVDLTECSAVIRAKRGILPIIAVFRIDGQ